MLGFGEPWSPSSTFYVHQRCAIKNDDDDDDDNDGERSVSYALYYESLQWPIYRK